MKTFTFQFKNSPDQPEVMSEELTKHHCEVNRIAGWDKLSIGESIESTGPLGIVQVITRVS